MATLCAHSLHDRDSDARVSSCMRVSRTFLLPGRLNQWGDHVALAFIGADGLSGWLAPTSMQARLCINTLLL
eukprot:11167629-Lingulodinium_polyedra.AAC.1